MPEIREWFQKQWKTKICAICDKLIKNLEDIGLDHKLAISRGGSPTLENCHLVHKECNLIKGDLSLEEIRHLILTTTPETWKIIKTRLKRSNTIFGRFTKRK